MNNELIVERQGPVAWLTVKPSGSSQRAQS